MLPHQAPVDVVKQSVSLDLPPGTLQEQFEGVQGPLSPVDVVVFLLWGTHRNNVERDIKL